MCTWGEIGAVGHRISYPGARTVSKSIEPSNVLPVSQIVEPEVGKDLLSEILRKGARELLAQAVKQEV